MKRYVVTNAQGRAANGETLVPGKYGHTTGLNRDEMLRQIGVCCCPTLESAALSSPYPPDQCRIFLVECWGSEQPETAYSVVREIDSIPQPSRFQRLAFAIALLSRAVQGLPSFREWAENWLQNRDRTSATAELLKAALQRPERPEAAEFTPIGVSAWARELETLTTEPAGNAADGARWRPRACALLQAVVASDIAERDVALGRALFGWGEWKVPVDNITKAILGLSSPTGRA